MRLKEIQRTAHQAWSPATHHPIYLALGTSAHQLDASFNTTAALEIFEVDFSDPSLDMKLKGSLPISNRLHSIIWANFEMGTDGSGGRLVGGSENGTLTVYNPEAILSPGVEAVVGQSDKHTGPIRALDFNPFKSNLLASGANDSEIYIWDLNHFNNPTMPGTKTQPGEDISVVSWNRQVQHILASADRSGKTAIWDLRKDEPIIKISDHSNRMHCSGMLWHPDVATQLVLASEDDRLPVMQMWDLRLPTSPLKVFENHTRGILSISWSQADSELLLSSAKDNRILCWNPNTGDVIYELPTSNQWCFDVQWCPRNPALLSAASLDGRISVYSVMGGSVEAQQLNTADKLSSSLDSTDPFGTGQVLHPLQVQQCAGQTTIVHPLQKPPKWVRRPVGASFAFGGKLIMFENPKLASAQRPHPRQVFVSQVTTETEFLQRSMELQTTLQSGSFISYCQAKIQNALTEADQDIWKFLLVKFENETRIKFLRLLGFNKDELDRKISKCLGKNLQANGHGVDAKDLAEKMQQLSTESSDEASTTGDIWTSGSASQFDLFSNIPKESPNFKISVSSDTDGLISQALLVANFEGAVELCLNESRYAEAILLSISGGEELLKKTQQRYLNEQRNSISMLILSVVTQNWKHIVQSCELDNWKEALAALLTYSHEEEFAYLCDTLGARLEGEGTEQRHLQACLCYICSGNVEKLVECCTLQKDCSTPLGLEDLVEKVMVLRKSFEHLHNIEVTVQSSILVEKLTYYAGILAAEGSLATAMAYLPENSDQPGIMMLKDRLFHAQGGAPIIQQTPVPYNNVDVSPGQPTPVGHPPTQKAQNQPAPPSQIAPVRESPMPSVFTPQSGANTGPGLPPSSKVLPPSAPHHGLQLPYPQHPTMGPGVPQQPFHPQPVGGSPAFPLPDSSITSTNLLGPSMQSPSCAPGGLPPMPSPGVPTTSLPSSPMPPSSQPRASVPMYSLAVHNQGPAPPSMTAGPYPAYLGPGFPHGGPGISAGNPYPAPAVLPPPTGSFPLWSSHSNDQQNGPSQKEVADNYSTPAPITAPVRALPGEAPQPHDPTQVPPGAPQESNVQLLQQLPAEMVEQKEIPAEHVVLRATFDSLVQRCLAAANPQTKRKLDDAPKRLGYLYDKLREQSLSQHVLGGLHEISCCVASQEYQRGLEVHTQVVSSSNFSEISAFMPILKIVITTAKKLGV